MRRRPQWPPASMGLAVLTGRLAPVLAIVALGEIAPPMVTPALRTRTPP